MTRRHRESIKAILERSKYDGCQIVIFKLKKCVGIASKLSGEPAYRQQNKSYSVVDRGVNGCARIRRRASGWASGSPGAAATTTPNATPPSRRRRRAAARCRRPSSSAAASALPCAATRGAGTATTCRTWWPLQKYANLLYPIIRHRQCTRSRKVIESSGSLPAYRQSALA